MLHTTSPSNKYHTGYSWVSESSNDLVANHQPKLRLPRHPLHRPRVAQIQLLKVQRPRKVLEEVLEALTPPPAWKAKGGHIGMNTETERLGHDDQHDWRECIHRWGSEAREGEMAPNEN